MVLGFKEPNGQVCKEMVNNLCQGTVTRMVRGESGYKGLKSD